jgi:hypothetical protein
MSNWTFPSDCLNSQELCRHGGRLRRRLLVSRVLDTISGMRDLGSLQLLHQIPVASLFLWESRNVGVENLKEGHPQATSIWLRE